MYPAINDLDLWDDEISIRELAALLAADAASVILLDVRTADEWARCRIDGAVHIPLDQLPARLHEIDHGRDIIVYCLAGIRSQHAIGIMRLAGFTRLRNLVGGIRAWATLTGLSLEKL